MRSFDRIALTRCRIGTEAIALLAAEGLARPPMFVLSFAMNAVHGTLRGHGVHLGYARLAGPNITNGSPAARYIA